MKGFRIIVFTVALLIDSAGFSQQPHVLLRYATAHIGDGKVIDNAYIAIQGAEITMVADGNTTRIDPSAYDTIIDLDGHHVFPGFIVMDSRLGLTEIDQIDVTHDHRDLGDFNPNLRALPAYNAESYIIETVRTNGVLMAQVSPNGGVISGTSSCVRLSGNNWQEAVVKSDEGIFLNWPVRAAYTGWWAEPGTSKENKDYAAQCLAIHSFFSDAKAYCVGADPVEKNLRFEAMRALFEGKKRLYIRSNAARDILDAVQFVRAHGLKEVVIVGGAEAALVTTELKENKISVVIERVHALPMHPDDPVDGPFKLAATLVAAGIPVAFATSGDMEAMISRNLPFQVGTAVHYGLEYEQAIASLTSVPARLLGVSSQYGTLEPGKRATLFVSAGDPLDIATNHVVFAMTDGQWLPLSNFQQALYLKYGGK